MPSSRGSSQPRDQTQVSMSPSLAGRFFTTAPYMFTYCRGRLEIKQTRSGDLDPHIPLYSMEKTQVIGLY